MDEPISKVLKQLQAQINTHEIRVSSLRTKQRSITGQITLYSVLIYLAYIVYYALGKKYELEGQTLLSWTLKIGVMLLIPVMYVFPHEVSDGKGVWDEKKCKMVVYETYRTRNPGERRCENSTK